MPSRGVLPVNAPSVTLASLVPIYGLEGWFVSLRARRRFPSSAPQVFGSLVKVLSVRQLVTRPLPSVRKPRTTSSDAVSLDSRGGSALVHQFETA
jgi:hypothetical protein